MTPANKKFIIAWTHAQARHFAKIRGWVRAEWEYLNPRQPDRLRGLYNVIIVHVRDVRYNPTELENYHMAALLDSVMDGIDSGRIRFNTHNLS